MTRHLLAAAAAALLVAGPAAAGPVAWSYGTELLDLTTGGIDFAPGRVTTAAGSASGSRSVTLFTLSPYTYGNPIDTGDLSARFTLTDAATGATHTFAFDGLASYSWDPQFPAPDEAVSLFPVGVPQRAAIGRTLYTVTLTGGADRPDGSMAYTASVAVNSPEPATAVLLAGLAAGGWVVRRRVGV